MHDIPVEFRRLISQILLVPEKSITFESHFVRDLGADSLDLLELSIVVKETLHVSIPEQAIQEIETVGDAVRLFSL